MSEGGQFPWKIQKLACAPSADYGKLRDPLPAPPRGMSWQHNPKTREWKLVSSTTKTENPSDEPAGDSGHHVAIADADITDATEASLNEDDWEVLSDRNNRAGSVRSLCSMESSSNTHVSAPHSNKIARTRSGSASTIDSLDNSKHRTTSGAKAGVLGVDYLEHVVLPSDTLQGICLAYKISSQRLRQANCFSGNNLLLAPKKLIIPLYGPNSSGAVARGPTVVRPQATDSPEYKIRYLQAEFPDLSVAEAKAYLELSDWNLEDAIRSAREDGEWEREMGDPDALHPGQIRIRVRGGRIVQASGAGLAPASPHFTPPQQGASTARKAAATARTHPVKSPGKPPIPAVVTPKRESPRMVSKEEIPDIATKSTKAQDVYAAAPQHDSYGVELKSLRQPLLSEDTTS